MVKSILFNFSLQAFFATYYAYMHWKFSHRYVLLQLWIQDLATIFILIYYNYRRGDDCIWQLIETMFLFFFKVSKPTPLDLYSLLLRGPGVQNLLHSYHDAGYLGYAAIDQAGLKTAKPSADELCSRGAASEDFVLPAAAADNLEVGAADNVVVVPNLFAALGVPGGMLANTDNFALQLLGDDVEDRKEEAAVLLFGRQRLDTADDARLHALSLSLPAPAFELLRRK